MAASRRLPSWFGIKLALAMILFGGLVVLHFGLHVSRAGVGEDNNADNARQVTVFGVLATPNSKTVDSRLSSVFRSQLEKLLPKNGFKLLDARSGCIVDGESISCSLKQGYHLTTLLVKPLDENGKVVLRCELFHDNFSEFTTLVKTPLDQLFFCRRELNDGSQLLIGVGRGAHTQKTIDRLSADDRL